jgi:hypothetical protein
MHWREFRGFLLLVAAVAALLGASAAADAIFGKPAGWVLAGAVLLCFALFVYSEPIDR